MPGMLFVVSVPSAATEKRLRQEIRSVARTKPSKETPPLEQVLGELLTKLQVEHPVWTLDKSGEYYQVVFPTGTGDPCENCLHCLTQLGIGKKFNSTVSIAPCNVFQQGVPGDPEVYDNDDEDSEMEKRWRNFVQSIRSKLTVKQVVEGVRSGAECSFDYVTLVLTADMIAAIGLIENSSVNIVAAMLVSPLMGPLMAATFGIMIADWKLVKIGVRSEGLGMLISLCFGFIFGLLLGSAQNEYPWGFTTFPSPEMMGRGNYRSLWIGVLYALPSGTGVALGLLQGAAGPLIGVAISASLLPPIVNCGMMWALACIYCAHDYMKYPYVDGENWDVHNFTSKLYKPIYYDYIPKDLAVMGIISFCLTLVNFVCIFVTAVVVLKVKEVASPWVSPPDLRRFWEHDIAATRATNRSTVRRGRSGRVALVADADKELLSDIRSIPEEELGATLEAAVREAMDDRTFRTVERCSFQAGNTDLVRALGLRGTAGAGGGVRASLGDGGEAQALGGAGDPHLLEQLMRSLLGQYAAATSAAAGGGGVKRGSLRPLSRSLRQSSQRSARGSWVHPHAKDKAGAAPGTPTRNSTVLPTILEGAKRASLTDRALQALGGATPPRRHSRHARHPSPPTPAARFHRRSNQRNPEETVSLTRAQEPDP